MWANDAAYDILALPSLNSFLKVYSIQAMWLPAKMGVTQLDKPMHKLLTITCVDVQLLACFRESILVPVASVAMQLNTCASTSVQATHLRSNGVAVLNSNVCFSPFRGVLKGVNVDQI